MSCRWLTPKQAAQLAQVTKDSVWRWVRDGKLPYSLTPGGAIRICKDELMKGSVYGKED